MFLQGFEPECPGTPSHFLYLKGFRKGLGLDIWDPIILLWGPLLNRVYVDILV